MCVGQVRLVTMLKIASAVNQNSTNGLLLAITIHKKKNIRRHRGRERDRNRQRPTDRQTDLRTQNGLGVFYVEMCGNGFLVPNLSHFNDFIPIPCLSETIISHSHFPLEQLLIPYHSHPHSVTEPRRTVCVFVKTKLSACGMPVVTRKEKH